MPRTTAARYLAVLVEEGLIHNEGRYYEFNLRRLDDPDFRAYFDRLVRSLRQTARKLSKMGIGVQQND
jgi:hypothetical protein